MAAQAALADDGPLPVLLDAMAALNQRADDVIERLRATVFAPNVAPFQTRLVKVFEPDFTRRPVARWRLAVWPVLFAAVTGVAAAGLAAKWQEAQRSGPQTQGVRR